MRGPKKSRASSGRHRLRLVVIMTVSMTTRIGLASRMRSARASRSSGSSRFRPPVGSSAGAFKRTASSGNPKSRAARNISGKARSAWTHSVRDPLGRSFTCPSGMGKPNQNRRARSSANRVFPVPGSEARTLSTPLASHPSQSQAPAGHIAAQVRQRQRIDRPPPGRLQGRRRGIGGGNGPEQFFRVGVAFQPSFPTPRAAHGEAGSPGDQSEAGAPRVTSLPPSVGFPVI